MDEMITRQDCGSANGQTVEAFEIEAGPYRARLLSLGAILQEMHVPDRNGVIRDIAIGYDEPEDYFKFRGSAGAICGRVANRIANATFDLDGTTYQLSKNLGENHLHGGTSGFNRKVWRAEVDEANNTVTFEYSSVDGEEGYPGRLDARVTYRLSDTGLLSVDMEAVTDQATVVNLVHHGYWNLAGHDTGDVREQLLWIDADRSTAVRDGGIPTGELPATAGTALDFRAPKPIGRDIEAASEGGGYDYNLCLNGAAGELRPVIAALDPASGRGLTISTDQPGVQLYTGNHFDAAPNIGKGGYDYGKYAGFALETQHFPDAPNHSNFPSIVLRPSETYRHRMHVQFFSTVSRDLDVSAAISTAQAGA
jgi:aldose 1-epimerase